MIIDYEDLECEKMPVTAKRRSSNRWLFLTGNYEWYVFRGETKRKTNKSKTK